MNWSLRDLELGLISDDWCFQDAEAGGEDAWAFVSTWEGVKHPVGGMIWDSEKEL